ncbi:MAG TPA: homoserine dehydrogenase [Candidatus Limnocylindrales bacterium]|nr:homoserine dehydrogenase [Candidatus Limnocylindrales bacterium]
MPDEPLRIAVLGAGTVGREVVRGVLGAQGELVDWGPGLELVGIAVRDLDRARTWGLAAAAGITESLLTDAPAHLVAAPDTDVIVELMGGDEPAHTLIAAALGAGKSVVTANKHVIAHYGAELESIARQTGAALRFEAAVGGGIPVLGPLANDLAANRFVEVRGIVNGTTNFILTAMHEVEQGYAEALADAQEAGYAEADPTADVEGIDAANKLVILARLAFGAWLDPETIERAAPRHDTEAAAPGITGISADDVSAAAAAGLVIKLVAHATHHTTGSAEEVGIAAAVMPTAVRTVSSLGRVSGTDNRIELRGNPIGRVAFEGPGAGGPATSSAVLADLLALAHGSGSTWGALKPASGLQAALPVSFDGVAEAYPSGARYPEVP